MSESTSGKLQDIQSWIKLVEKEKTSKLAYITNRISMVNKIFTSTEKWLEQLRFVEKQELEKLEFENVRQKMPEMQ